MFFVESEVADDAEKSLRMLAGAIPDVVSLLSLTSGAHST